MFRQRKQRVDQLTPTCVLFNESAQQFVVTAASDVFAFNARTGELLKSFPSLVKSEIAVLQLDCRQRRLVVGCHDGTISVYNTVNGELMRECTPHTDTHVIGMHYCKDVRSFVSVGYNGTVHFHDDGVECEGETSMRGVDMCHR